MRVSIVPNGGSHEHHSEASKIPPDHVLAAAAFEGAIVEYATLHNLKTKNIYQWKTALVKRGFLPMTESKAEIDIFTTIPVDQAVPTPNDALPVKCRLTRSGGSLLGHFTPIVPEAMSRLLSAVRSH